MEELLEKLEAAEGPDRELDNMICAVFKQCTIGVGTDAESALLCSAMCAPYTNSIDAAVSLLEQVLPRWGWACSSGPKARASVYAQRGLRETPLYSKHATPALALCAAIVTAKIAEAK